ncbi:MAG: D-2-hydroxyacid dehydrogenase [bacterium]|nr:D-2-hydroxyacid dehydrogenase [bacterium]
MKILVFFPFTAPQLAELSELAGSLGGHEIVHANTEEEAVQLATGCEVLLGYFPPPVAAATRDLRWIQSFSAGMDKFLYPEIIERGEVVVTNMAGLYAPQGGEHAWAFLLALTRGLLPSIRNMAERSWGLSGPIVELTGSTLGIIGLGGFGTETLQRAAGFGMRVIALDPVRLTAPPGVDAVRPPTRENLHWLLAAADAVVVACPLTAETRHMIGPEELAAMKSSAYLVCVSRGGIIDEEALAQALHNGDIAGLDVVEAEPLGTDSPLWDAPNLILTPHRAGASQHRPRKTFEFFRDNLARYLRDEPLVNVVDKRRGF